MAFCEAFGSAETFFALLKLKAWLQKSKYHVLIHSQSKKSHAVLCFLQNVLTLRRENKIC